MRVLPEGEIAMLFPDTIRSRPFCEFSCQPLHRLRKCWRLHVLHNWRVSVAAVHFGNSEDSCSNHQRLFDVGEE